MPNIINRETAEALIRTQVMNTIFQEETKSSIVLRLGRRLPNMTSKQTRIPVLDLMPMAYWVNGDTGYKRISHQAWDNVYLTAGELAVIVPIPEAVLDDASFDIIGEVTPRVREAIDKAIDEAIIFGINRPPEWQNDIITMARQAGNNVTGGITYDTIMNVDGLLSKIEQMGYNTNGIVASMRTRGALRGLKDDNGRPIFVTDMQGPTRYALDGAPLFFPENGSFDDSVAQMVAGNWSQLVYSIRQDITVKILDQGVIQDPATKDIIYNLPQQDMIAIRVVMRLGWALPNPVSALNPDRSNVPFAYIEPATAVTMQTVTLTVKDGTDANVEGASINLNGSIKKTGTDGTAAFYLRSGDYPYMVKKDGHRPMSGVITVANSAVTQNVVLPSNDPQAAATANTMNMSRSRSKASEM